MIWEEIIQHLKLQKLLLLNFNIVFIFLYVFSMPAFFNLQYETAGIFSIVNPANQNNNSIKIGSFYNFNMKELITNYMQINYNYKKSNYGLFIITNNNNILNQYTFSPQMNFHINNMSMGIAFDLRYLSYTDSINIMDYGMRIGNKIKQNNFFSEILMHYYNKTLSGGVIFGLDYSSYKVYINTFYKTMFYYSAGFDFNMNDIFQIGLCIDNENRIMSELCFSKTLYRIKYLTMIHNELGLSHSLNMSIVFPSYNYDFEKIHTIENQEIEYTIKVKTLIPFDINSANKKQIMLIPTIGEKTAQRILDRRMLLGIFENYEQIDSINGIGNKTLQLIKKYTYIGEKNGKNIKE